MPIIMSKITKEEIIKLAKLARIGLSEEEISSLEKEMSSILEYVELLKEVDVTGVEPTNQVTGLLNTTRQDKIVDPQISREDLLANAPETENGFIKVKSVL